SQIFTVRPPPEARCLPSGLKATLLTSTVGKKGTVSLVFCPLCPSQDRSSFPLWASHTFTVLSLEPLPRRFQSGLKATLASLPKSPLLTCPLRARSSCPVCASHTFTVWSAEPLARRLPSGLKAKLVTALVCPLKERSSWPVCASHTFTVLSPE